MREPVSIIISSYEHYDLTNRCIQSLLKWNSTIKDQIIIVDDGSGRETIAFLERLASRIKPTGRSVLVFSKPRGETMELSKCRQMGRGAATNDWVMWIDNDTEFAFCDPIETLQNSWRSLGFSDVGGIQPQRINRNRDVFGANSHRSDLEYSGTNLIGIAQAMYPEGACWMSHRSTFDKWSYDESLYGFEDSDIGFQMWKSELKIYCDNSVRVKHDQWASSAWGIAAGNGSRAAVLAKWEDYIPQRFIGS